MISRLLFGTICCYAYKHASSVFFFYINQLHGCKTVVGTIMVGLRLMGEVEYV
jgi:hypothetical protein